MSASASTESLTPPRVLLTHHLRQLKLPTVLREYEKVALEAARDGQDHVRYLLRLVELELIDRERRMVERRMRAALRNSHRTERIVAKHTLWFGYRGRDKHGVRPGGGRPVPPGSSNSGRDFRSHRRSPVDVRRRFYELAAAGSAPIAPDHEHRCVERRG